MAINYNQGLSSQEAKLKQEKEGLNSLRKEKKKNIWKIIFSQINDPGVFLLLIAGSLSFILREFVDAGIIVFVIILNTCISTFQEIKAEKALESLKKLSSPTAKVLRDHKLVRISSFEVCKGDIVFIEEGDIVPADLILLEANNLKIDESLLTGESFPIEKKVQKTNSTILADQVGKVFSSSKVICGNGIGECINIGMQTEVGKIAKMIDVNVEQTPLQIRLSKLSKALGLFTIFLVTGLFLYSILNKGNILEMLILSISLAVAAIPEGLPAVVTIVLSLGVNKLVRNNVITRSLPSIETLGSLNVICSDKTGTITKNELTVKETVTFSTDNTLFIEALSSNQNVKNDIGDPLEVAVTKYLHIHNQFVSLPRVKEFPFSSDRKMMSVVVQKNNQRMIYSKGACSALLTKCNYIYYQNKIVKMDSSYQLKIKKEEDRLSSKAYRVIGYAYQNSQEENDLIFLGLIGLIDPPREGIKDSVETLNKAGIKVLMVTGDNIETSYQIAKEVGICSKKEECILGSELDTNPNLDLKNYKVFARVNPHHKLKIVNYYQKLNQVVAMTGDGINDAPALKKANVGIAMGKNGSDVAKDSADIILSDDNFSTIEKAVEEGRNIYTNIKKSILFLLSSNLGEILTMFFFMIIGLPSPLVSIHILWVNLISDSLPALALGSDDKYDDIMVDKPRNKDESLFARGGYKVTLVYGFIIFLITSIAFFIVPYVELQKQGDSFHLQNIKMILLDAEILTKSRTLAFTTLGISQLFHMIGMSNIKKTIFTILKRKNIMMVVAFFLGIFLQVIVTKVPFLVTFFKTSYISFKEWMWLLLLSSFPLVIHELMKSSLKTNF